MNNEKIELLFEELNDKNQEILGRNNPSSDIHIENLLIGILFLFVVKNRKLNPLKLAENPEEKYYKVSKMNSLIRDVTPYFGYTGRGMLVNIESILNIAENLYGIGSGESKNRARTMNRISHPKKHIKILETVAPYLEGKGRENTDKLLRIDQKIERLQRNDRKDILKSGQDIIEIMDLLNIKKARELKQNINTIKTFISLFNN